MAGDFVYKGCFVCVDRGFRETAIAIEQVRHRSGIAARFELRRPPGSAPPASVQRASFRAGWWSASGPDPRPSSRRAGSASCSRRGACATWSPYPPRRPPLRRPAGSGFRSSTIPIPSEIDLTIDGADEVDPPLNLIKGGGGAKFREKIVAEASRRVVIVVDESKLSPALGTRHALPVEVARFGWKSQERFLAELGLKPSPPAHTRRKNLRDGSGQLDSGLFDPGSMGDPESPRGGACRPRRPHRARPLLWHRFGSHRGRGNGPARAHRERSIF